METEFKEIMDVINSYLYGIVISTYSVILGLYFIIVRKRYVRQKEEFFSSIIKGVSDKIIIKIEDFHSIYLGIFNKTEIGRRSSFTRLLNELLVEVTQGIVKGKVLESKDKAEIASVVKEIIKQNKEISPFSELPETEKNILNDIIKEASVTDNAFIKSKIEQIANTIQARFNELNKTKRINRVSIIVAIVGVILTIIFGLTSIIG